MKNKFEINLRTKTIFMLVFCTLFLLAIIVAGSFINESHYGSNFSQKNLPPSLEHLFGTDWLGRDMFYRSLKGMTTSIWIGLIASLVSSVLAVVLGTLAATAGKKVDSAILWLGSVSGKASPYLPYVHLHTCGKRS